MPSLVMAAREKWRHLRETFLPSFPQIGNKRRNSGPPISSNFTVRGFSALSDEETIKLLGETFKDELEYLQNAETTPEKNTAATPNTEFQTPSQRLYGADYDEVNRTLLGMLAFKWILANDHKSFIQSQPPPVALKAESFAKFRKLCMSQFETSDNILPLLTAILINDLGKSHRLVKEVEKATEGTMAEVNHDEIVYIAAQKNMVHCLQKLSASQREDVLLGLKLGSTLNIAQFAQAENVPASLAGAKVMKRNKRAFDLKFLEVLFDVAGAAANLDARGAKAMIEPVYRNYMIVHPILVDVVGKRGTHRENYDRLLIAHSNILKDQGFPPLSVENPQDRALLRLMIMGRSTSNKKQAELFDDAFRKHLAPQERQRLVDGLNVDGTDDGEAILPYYMPAIFSEGLKHTPGERDAKIEALASMMRLLGRVYGGSKPEKGRPGGVKERNLRRVTEVIHGEDFQKDPGVLDKVDVNQFA